MYMYTYIRPFRIYHTDRTNLLRHMLYRNSYINTVQQTQTSNLLCSMGLSKGNSPVTVVAVCINLPITEGTMLLREFPHYVAVNTTNRSYHIRKSPEWLVTTSDVISSKPLVRDVYEHNTCTSYHETQPSLGIHSRMWFI